MAAPSVAAPSIVWSALHDSWHLDRSKSTRALDVYVPTSVDLKVSRFRPRMEFEADGTLRVLAFGHTDRHRMVEGTWTRTGESITLRYDASEHSESVVRTLEVESLKQGELVLKRRAREGQGSAS